MAGLDIQSPPTKRVSIPKTTFKLRFQETKTGKKGQEYIHFYMEGSNGLVKSLPYWGTGLQLEVG